MIYTISSADRHTDSHAGADSRTVEPLSDLKFLNFGDTIHDTVQDTIHISLENTVQDTVQAPLEGNTIYAFGDSLIGGHMYTKAGFVTIAARQEGMTLINKACNGATIRRTEARSHIADQMQGIDEAAPAPDFIVFNGGTNDIYTHSTAAPGSDASSPHAPGPGADADGDDLLGAVSPGKDLASLNPDTFAGSFERTIAAMRQRWPDAAIVYVSAGTMGAYDLDLQRSYWKLALEACHKWGVAVADVFANTTLDTRSDLHNMLYSFDSLGPTGLPASYEDNVAQGSIPSGTHPNFASIERFYLPTLLEAMRR